MASDITFSSINGRWVSASTGHLHFFIRFLSTIDCHAQATYKIGRTCNMKYIASFCYLSVIYCFEILTEHAFWPHP